MYIKEIISSVHKIWTKLTCMTNGSISSLLATLDLAGTPKLPKQMAPVMAAPYL